MSAAAISARPGSPKAATSRWRETLLGEVNYDGYFLEYDTERAGGFEPLRFLPKGNKSVVLGLVTSKSGTLEKKDDVKRRIEEAAKFAPSRAVLPVAAMRLRLDRGGQHPRRGGAMGEAADDRRAGGRSVGTMSFACRSVCRRRASGDPYPRAGGYGPPLSRGRQRQSSRQAIETTRLIMQRTKPPFRADHVGSLLRTAPLKDRAGEAGERLHRRRATTGDRGPRDREGHQEAGADRLAARHRRRVPPLVVALRLLQGPRRGGRPTPPTRASSSTACRRARKGSRSPAAWAFPATPCSIISASSRTMRGWRRR